MKNEKYHFQGLMVVLLCVLCSKGLEAQQVAPVLEPPYRLSAAAFTWGMVSSGSQYFHDEWLSGSVVMTNGVVLGDKLLRYHGLLDELVWLPSPVQAPMHVDKGLVRSFSLKFPASPAMVTFVNMEAHPDYRDYGLTFFGQQLHRGVASLVVHRQIRQRGTQSRTSGGKIYHIPILRKAPVYYVLMPGYQHGSLQKISHRNFLRLFAGRQAEVRELLRDKGIRVRTEADLLRAVEALDSYLTHNQSW